MPTHRDYPWERDARARRGRSARAQPTGRVALAVLLLAVAALLGLKAYDARALSSAGGTSPRVIPAGAVTRLHSRISRSGKLELWGTSTAPDGASIALSAQSRGVDIPIHPAPVVAGHFYGVARVPAAERGEGLRVSATVAP